MKSSCVVFLLPIMIYITQPFGSRAINPSPIAGAWSGSRALYESFDSVRINVNIEQELLLVNTEHVYWRRAYWKMYTLCLRPPPSPSPPRHRAEKTFWVPSIRDHIGSWGECWAKKEENIKRRAGYRLPACYLHNVVIDLRFSGLRISLSRTVTIWQNLGRSLRSFCQQSSMSVWRAAGQPIGAGSLYPSSTDFITCTHKHRPAGTAL